MVRLIPHIYVTKESILLVSPEQYTNIISKIEDINTIQDSETRLKELCLLIGLDTFIFTKYGE